MAYSSGSLSDLCELAAGADFICVDTETANEQRASLCAIGVAIVTRGQVIAEAAEIVDPECEFNPFNSMVNGITPGTVLGAPTLPEMWPALVRLFSGQTIVCHNAGFDVSVLRSSASRYSLVGFDALLACSMRFSRRVWPSAPSYGLDSLAEELDIELDHHQADSDAAACAALTLAAMSERCVGSLAEMIEGLEMRFGVLGPDSFIPIWTKPAPEPKKKDPAADADPDGPIYGLTVCFTGALLSMVRHDAAELVSQGGATFVTTMSKKVDLLVVGDADYLEFVDGNRTAKLQKAADLRAAGKGPEIVREADFFRMLDV